MAEYKLPVLTGGELTTGDLLRWDGDNWVNYPDSNYAGGSDEKVGVDAEATAGYLGAANNDGVLRTGDSLSYVDGENYITIDTIQDIRTSSSPTFAGLSLGTGKLDCGKATIGTLAKLELDYMEYANNANARTAYVTDDEYSTDLIPTMTSNTEPSGVASASSEFSSDYAAWKVFDDDSESRWADSVGYPAWIKYDFGAGNEKIIVKITVKPYLAGDIKNWVFSGSNNDSDWDQLDAGLHTESADKFSIVFENTTAYRYYKFDVTDGHLGTFCDIFEIEMMEQILQCYSEDTIYEQGTYSLKITAKATDSLNNTLTRTVSPTINLSQYSTIKIDVRASRTGSQFKIGFHDSGGTTTEHTPNILQADTWQTETIDISGVSDANKNTIDSIIIAIINADAANTIYIDNMFSPAGSLSDPGSNNLKIKGVLSSGQTTCSSSSDAFDVSGANSILVDSSGGDVVLGGLTGGVAGQILIITHHITGNNLTLEANEATGTQKFRLIDDSDETLSSHGGWTLVCDGTDWFGGNHAKHV